MSEVAAAPSCRAALISGGLPRFKRNPIKPSLKWQCNVKQSRMMKIEAQMASPSTYSSRIATDIPLYEIPGASFDQYLEDKPRVFKAIFPDKRRSQQINEIRWELQGLDDMLKPSQFSLSVKGALYPDRRGPRSRLKGQLQMSISFILPHVLAMVPDDIRRDVAESVLKRLVENMKNKVNGSLVADYTEFKRERPKALATHLKRPEIL